MKTKLKEMEELLAESRPQVRVPLVEQRPTRLALLTDNSLCFFDLQTRAWGREITLAERIPVGDFSTWVILEDGRLFVRVLTVNYVLNAKGRIVSRTDMKMKRWHPGVIALKQTVFVFGGLADTQIGNAYSRK